MSMVNTLLLDLRKKVYSIQIPEAIILNLDSTLLNAYGKQEDSAFNFHYQSNGYPTAYNFSSYPIHLLPCFINNIHILFFTFFNVHTTFLHFVCVILV